MILFEKQAEDAKEVKPQREAGEFSEHYKGFPIQF